MGFLAGWALAGLVLLGPLVFGHLRRRSAAVQEVPSLLLWHEFALETPGARRRLAPPSLPLLLALQALALVLLVLVLAEPVLSGGSTAPQTVVVLDDSFWMTAPGVLADAKREAATTLRELAPSSTVQIVLADASPSVLYRGSPSAALGALRSLHAGVSAPDLSAGLLLAAGELSGPRDRVILIRAPQDPVPALHASSGELVTRVAGTPTSDRGISNPTARCGIGAPAGCEVLATLSNAGPDPAKVRVRAEVQGRPSVLISARVAVNAQTQIHLPVPPGVQVSLTLVGADAGAGVDGVSLDNTARVAVPGDDDIPRAARVTVVGEPSQARSLAQALAAVPGVRLSVETPAQYRARSVRSSDLVVLDDSGTRGGLSRDVLARAPALMLVDPDRLPGGRVSAAQADATPSGTDAQSPLLQGADLSSLNLAPGAARRLTLPRWLAPVLWSPAGPLLAAGDNGHQRVSVIAFTPNRSNLAQLNAFPVLMANLVRWSLGWAPASAQAGAPVSVDALPGARVATLSQNGKVIERVVLGRTAAALQAPTPGLYSLSETGPGVSHQVSLDVNLGAPAAIGALDVDLGVSQLHPSRSPRTPLASWLLAVALVVLVLEWAYWFSRVGRGAQGRGRLITLVPGVALLLGLLALLSPLLASSSTAPTTFVVDRSASIDAASARVERRWTRTLALDHCSAPCRTVNFAATTDAVADRTGVPGRPNTDLQSAVTAGVTLARRGGRVVVLSDGGQTQGSVLSNAVAGAAVTRGVRVDWLALSESGRRDAAITSIHVPAVVRVGDEVPLAITIHSTVNGTARLGVGRDGGAPVTEEVHLRAGDNPLALSYTAIQPGWSSFTVTVTLPGDAVGADNAAAAVVDVRPAPRVLVVSDRLGSPVPSLLSGEKLDVRTIAPGALPDDAAAYGVEDAVVLDDVPATALTASQISALDGAVRMGGLGLLALGGPHSFSEGRYSGSRLQQILPVKSAKPGNLQRRNLAIELVLDHSGSMIDLAGGAPKIAEARASARQAAAFIASRRDQLGIVDFDTAAHTLLPLESVTPGASERSVDARIARLAAGGGTNIYAGLQAGFNQLLRSHAPQRHLILVTDGISTGSDYGPLLALLRRAKISVATVALGSDADRSLLGQIARSTGGHTYATDNAGDLPRILVKETQESAKPVRVTGRLAVSVSGDSPVVRSLAGSRLPGLAGNVVVTLKAGAQADLSASAQGSAHSPALAEWQIGAGRVLAWTPGLGAPWAAGWLGRTALWNDAVRWSARGLAAGATQLSVSSPGTLALDLSSRGATALGDSPVGGSLTGADGVSHPVVLTQTGPAKYHASVTGLAPGVYRYALVSQTAGGFSAAGEVALPYPAEYSPVPAHISPLGQSVAQTGGRELPGDPGALSGAEPGPDRGLILLALIAFGAGVGLRMSPRVRPGIPV